MPGFPVHSQLPELTQTHVHPVGDTIQPSHLLSSPSPPAFSLSQGLFQLISSSHPEKAMAPHSSTLAWKIPWTEGPGRLQSMGSLGVRHDWATSLSLFTFMHWIRKWQPTPVFLPGESQGWGAWWPAIYGVPQSRIRLKRLSSSSSSSSHQVAKVLELQPQYQSFQWIFRTDFL